MKKLRVGLLGPLSVTNENRDLHLPTSQQCTLLATLALRVGQVVPVNELAGRLWDREPPRSAHTAVRRQMKRLRRALGGGVGRDGRLIIHGQDGYRLDPDCVDVDVRRFRELLDRAVITSTESTEAQLLDQALSLWRGSALTGVACPSLRQEMAPLLREEQLWAAHRRIEIGLRHGEAEQHIASLRRLLSHDPLQERFWEQLLWALHLCGRQTEALREYGYCRRHLMDTLGVAPGPRLRELHRLLSGAEPVAMLGRPT